MSTPIWEAPLASIAALLLAPALLTAVGQQTALDPPQDTAEATVEPSEVVGPPAGSQRAGAELEELTDAISAKMRCPVCQGLSVAASPSPTAVAMRNEIRNLLAQGYSRQQVFDYFEGTYGEFVLLEPKPEGFNLTVWLAPVLAVLLGAGLVFAYVARNNARASAASVDDDSALDEYRERVRQETQT